MSEPRVVVVIPNWGGKADTLECLQSLAQQNYQNLEIMVVDNGSGSGSVEVIREGFPETTLICNEENLGTAVAENMAMAHALWNGAGYIGILNNDTTFDWAARPGLDH